MRTVSVKPFQISTRYQFNAFLEKYTARLHWPVLLTGAGLATVFIVVLAIIQFSTPNLAGNDGYFHIRFAQVMRTEGLLVPFIWLPLTILNAEAYFDHHFLYHVLMIPFTFGDLRVGAKWMSVLFPAGAFLMGWIFLRGQRVPYAALWALGFMAVSAAFLYRMSMPRVQAVSLLMLMLIMHVTLTRRYRWLLPLSFIYVWLYDAFPFIVIVVGTYVATRWILDRRFNLAPLLYAGLGIGLGLLINPYFPKNIEFIYHHMLPKLTDATATKVGKEWYPYQTWTLVKNSSLALFAFAAGAFALGLRDRRMGARTATVFMITIVFGFFLFKSRRFVEYYPALALLFCAVAWAPLFKQWQHANFWMGKLPAVVLLLIFVPATWLNVRAVQEQLADSKPYQRYEQASAWLQTNTPPQSRVFQTDWDDFTQLYFYNTHNTYTLGLDPTYMQLYNADMYDLWRDITKGKVDNPSQVIVDTFEARYVITDLNHKKFLRKAKEDPHLDEVHRDDYAAVFQIVELPKNKGGEASE